MQWLSLTSYTVGANIIKSNSPTDEQSESHEDKLTANEAIFFSMRNNQLSAYVKSNTQSAL